MSKWTLRSLPLRAAAVLGLATLATAATIGAATAAPGDGAHPLLDTTCSAEQIEAALAARAPELAAKLAQHPEHRAKLGELLAMSPEQRRALIQQRQGEHDGHHDGAHAGHHAQLSEALATCGEY
ncbi:hemophore-related protein [Nocardia neocaledoniensis]|uniref:hemophore-related protein n=1 Tax=Nocardia neocaledoniensis TaxID=236511 RepID=UPI002458EA84|nr:hemophore-related protein [Nocardia neocaledoniensis]